MFKPGQIEKIPKEYEKIMRDLEEEIIVDIAKRIKKTGEITSAADWEAFRLHQLGKSKWWIKRRIKKAADLTWRKTNKLYRETFAADYARNSKLYGILGARIIPFAKNKELQQSIDAVLKQTEQQLENITRTSGFSVRMGGKKVFTPVHQYFTDELDKSMISIQNGLSTADKEVSRVVKNMVSSGFQTVYYDSGKIRSVESAVRMCVMTGFTQVIAKNNESNAKALGTDMFEVSYHSTARPSHQAWQGRIYTKQQLVDICGLGTASGLCGVNCYHTYYPFIPGISTRAYTDEELDKLNADANKTKKYDGIEYTKYEASRRMRDIERHIRKQKKLISCMEKAGADMEDITIAKGKYKALSQKYVSFADRMDLPQERSRLEIDK